MGLLIKDVTSNGIEQTSFNSDTGKISKIVKCLLDRERDKNFNQIFHLYTKRKHYQYRRQMNWIHYCPNLKMKTVFDHLIPEHRSLVEHGVAIHFFCLSRSHSYITLYNTTDLFSFYIHNWILHHICFLQLHLPIMA